MSMGPFEKEIAELLNEAMGKTVLGLEVRLEGAITPAVEEAIDALSVEQRAQVFLEALTGWAIAARKIAARIDAIQTAGSNGDPD